MNTSIQQPRHLTGSLFSRLFGALFITTTLLSNVAAVAGAGMTSFDRKHQNPLGGKGQDQFKIDQPALACGRVGKVFDHAKLIIRKQRFANATLGKQPLPGCTRCSPLVVDWINEPTGKLDYQLQVYWRKVEGECGD